MSARLGRGSMAEVHAAEHVRLGSRVAIKFLRASVMDARSIERFRHEARRVAALQSENVVRVFDCGELGDGTPFLVMERLFGEDLRALLAREHLLPIRRAVQIAEGACRGLAVVHAAGLVHRDLKPANLFVERTPDGGERCKILDFGVAKALENESTRPGAVIGTVRYMAPEQLENAAAATASADVYALGAILYECLTGEAVHAGETLQQTMFNILHRDVRPPSELRPLPHVLEAVLLRALARDATARFANIGDMAAALAPFGRTERYRPGTGGGLDDDTERDLDRGVVPAAVDRGRVTRPALALGVFALGVGLVGGWLARGRTVESAPPAPPVVAARLPLASEPPPAFVTRSPSGSSVPSASSVAPRPVVTGRPRSIAAPKPTPPAAGSAPIAVGQFDLTDPYE